MSKKTKAMNGLPWFKFWTGYFKTKTDHLSNAEVGAYVRLQASYWDNNGLPLDGLALSRIARIEEGDDLVLEEILGEFFYAKDGILRHEELDTQRVDAIGEEDANKRRTLPARLALAEYRNHVTVPVTETEVEVDEEGDAESEEYPDPESKSEEYPDSESEGNPHPGEEPDAQDYAEQLQQAAGDVGSQILAAPTRPHQSASLKPDGGAQGGAAPAVSAAESGISFLLKDGSNVPLSAFWGETQLSDTEVSALSKLAEKFESSPQSRVPREWLPRVTSRWLQHSRRAA